MRIRMFSLCAERELAQRKLEAKIADALHGFASNELEFEDFSSPQEMLAPLGESLKNEALTVVAVEKPAYNKIKKKLLPAMGYPLSENAEIKELVSKKEDIDADRITSHSLFPADARLFPSTDGMFSGFSVTKGDKFFLMIPLDKNRIDDMLENCVVPYLVSLFGQPQAAEDDFVPVQKKEKQSFSSPLVRSVNLLKEANSRVAFCANRQEPIIDEVIKSIEGSEDMFVFSPHVEDRGDIDVVSYSVQLARAAKNLSHTELGAVISDPFDDGNGRGVCISITDGEKAIARRFYAEDGETDDSLVRAAAEEAIALLGQNAYGVLSENAIGPDNVPTEKIAGKKTVKAILIILVIILALCIGAGVVFKYLESKEPETTAPVSTVAPTITTTEPKAKPVEEKDLMAHIVELATGEEEHRVKKDDAEPTTFIRNGEEVNAKDYLALILQNAINDDDEWSSESLKAMAVIIYTNLKYRDNNFDISDVAVANTADAETKEAVEAVFGDYLTYEDYVIFAPYHRYSAGKTASSGTVYGVEYPYLIPVDMTADKNVNDYKYDIAVTTSDLNTSIIKATSNNLSDFSTEPKDWLKIKEHDKAFDADSGYVSQISVGSENMTGYEFIKILDKYCSKKITSMCFDVSYSSEDKEFIFTCYGFGSGVGLSQRGAIRLDKRDHNTYEEILSYFYPGTELQKGEASQKAEEEETSSTARRQQTPARTNTTTRASAPDNTTRPTTEPSTTRPTTEPSTTRPTTEPSTTKATQPQTSESPAPTEEDEGLEDVSQ